MTKDFAQGSPPSSEPLRDPSAFPKPNTGLPLRLRIPAILAGIAILWWVMNGGARILINGAVEHIARPDRSIENALQIASESKPKGTAWMADLLQRACAQDSPVPQLRGLDYVIFHDGVRDKSLPSGIHTGCFYDAESERAFFDVGSLAAIDQFARPRPDLVKSFAVAMVLARRTAPDIKGEALIVEAGRLASALPLFPPGPGARSPAALIVLPFTLAAFDKNRTVDKPPGWTNYLMLPAIQLPPATDEAAAAKAVATAAAAAFSAGLLE